VNFKSTLISPRQFQKISNRYKFPLFLKHSLYFRPSPIRKESDDWYYLSITNFVSLITRLWIIFNWLIDAMRQYRDMLRISSVNKVCSSTISTMKFARSRLHQVFIIQSRLNIWICSHPILVTQYCWLKLFYGFTI